MESIKYIKGKRILKEDDLITLDEDLAIKDAIKSDGPAYFLNLNDEDTDEFGYQDNYYFIIINVE